MKIIFFLLLLLSFGPLAAQKTLTNKSLELAFVSRSEQDLEKEILKRLHLEKNHLKLKKVNQVKSLTGTHIGFNLMTDLIQWQPFYIRAHIDNEGVLFLIQHNLDLELIQEVLDNKLRKEQIYEQFYESYTIEQLEYVYALNPLGQFQKAVAITYYEESKDIYKKRIYFSNEEFEEKDLKIHFAPIDTLLKGRVFSPDPLTSSSKEYGDGNYKDEFIEDTILIIIDSIPNDGQAIINTERDTFFLFNDTIIVDPDIAANNFSGQFVYLVFERIFLNTQGSVLGFNTVFLDSIQGNTKLITEDYGFDELNDEQIDIEVLGDYSNFEFRLKNPYFEIAEFSFPVFEPYSSAINDFSFSRSHKAFEEINALYHLTTFHDYIEELGFLDLDPEKILVDVHGSLNDNSFFTNLPSPRLAFGDGGVDDAEDADVIIHEYTHALSFFAAPNTNTGAERTALDEGLGDYFATSYSALLHDFNRYNVFSWDGHNSFWSGRISNSNNTYEDLNVGGSIHLNGVIISSALVAIQEKIGIEKTDILVLESLFYNFAGMSFLDYANNLLTIEKMLYQEKYYCDIINILEERKLIDNNCDNGSNNDSNILVQNTENFTLGTGLAEVRIRENNFENLSYWVSDALGRLYIQKENLNQNSFSISPEEVGAKGVYFVRVQTKSNKYEFKLVK